MSGQATWLVFVGTLLACAAAVLAIIGFADKNTMLGIAGIVATIVVIIGIVVLYRRLGAAGKAAFDEAMRSDFAPMESGWYHASGLAIDRSRRVLLVGTAQGVRRVPFNQIGSVAYYRNKTGPAVGGNSLLTLILLPMVISAMIHNSTKAGLHVGVGGQSLRIIGIKPADAERWQSQLEAARSA